MSLPTDDKARKALPIFRGPISYFPDALLELARVCKAGNDQHNPGEPLHWAREKSVEQMDTAMRHMMDHGTGNPVDVDNTYHLAKAAWRLLAELQLTIEEREGRITRDKHGVPHVVTRESRMDAAPDNAVPVAITDDVMSSEREAAELRAKMHATAIATREQAFDVSDVKRSEYDADGDGGRYLAPGVRL